MEIKDQMAIVTSDHVIKAPMAIEDRTGHATSDPVTADPIIKDPIIKDPMEIEGPVIRSLPARPNERTQAGLSSRVHRQGSA
jgi:hypothetical protein